MKSAQNIAGYLYEMILKRQPKFKGDPAKWIRDIELALRVDGRGEMEMMNAIDWIHTHPKGAFWIPNIQSGKKLREKFDQLDAQALASEKRNGVMSAYKAMKNVEAMERRGEV